MKIFPIHIRAVWNGPYGVTTYLTDWDGLIVAYYDIERDRWRPGQGESLPINEEGRKLLADLINVAMEAGR